eukprot:scaffold28547_cov57-Phaeocystis_antarctica.AAC.2
MQRSMCAAQVRQSLRPWIPAPVMTQPSASRSHTGGEVCLIATAIATRGWSTAPVATSVAWMATTTRVARPRMPRGRRRKIACLSGSRSFHAKCTSETGIRKQQHGVQVYRV